jgi:hypothetical protein
MEYMEGEDLQRDLHGWIMEGNPQYEVYAVREW